MKKWNVTLYENEKTLLGPVVIEAMKDLDAVVHAMEQVNGGKVFSQNLRFTVTPVEAESVAGVSQ